MHLPSMYSITAKVIHDPNDGGFLTWFFYTDSERYMEGRFFLESKPPFIFLAFSSDH